MPTDPITELATQLQAFVRIKHPFASNLDSEILQSIESYARPSTSSSGPASTSQERTSRSVAQPPKTSLYSVEWADSQAKLRTAVQRFQKLLKQQTNLGLTNAIPEALQSHANPLTDPINSTITEESAPLISTAQAPELDQPVSQETTTMSGNSDSPRGRDSTPPGGRETASPSVDGRQNLHQDLRQELCQEITQLILEILGRQP